MTLLRRALSTGVLAPRQHAVLTGAVLIYLAWLLGSVDDDRAAPVVAIVLAVVGLAQLGRAARRRRHAPTRGVSAG